MFITMDDSRINTISDIHQFLNGSSHIEFHIPDKEHAYQWVENTLITFRYICCSKSAKGVIKEYLEKVTGYSQPQVTRLIRRYVKTGKVKRKAGGGHRFRRIYTIQDIILLAKTDQLHNYPNGNALSVIFYRMRYRYEDLAYQRLAHISVSHIYILRQTAEYKRLNKEYQKTKPHVVNIGERRKPEPNGKPGYIRVDTVHQGDQDGGKGVYHINLIDEITQYQLIAAVEGISERFLLLILKTLLELFPFKVLGFHSDNGSEFINHRVAKMLNKLLIQQTKSRPRKTNDNALVEGKNGSVIRKWIGYYFIPKNQASAVNDFYFGGFHEYVNYHRACAFATIITDKKGKQKKIYKRENYQIPYEKFKSLPNAKSYLKPGITFEMLDKISMRYTDNEMAEIVQKGKEKLYDQIYPMIQSL